MPKLVVKSRYGTIPNDVLNSKLSFKAKGLYAFIQSKPDGWKFSAERIKKTSGDGLTRIKSGLKELETVGLLKRIKYKDQKGHWEWDYVLLEKPPVENQPVDSEPVDSELVETLPNISKQEVVKKRSKKEVVNSEPSSQEIVTIIDLFIVFNKAGKSWYGNKTQRASIKRLIEEYGAENVMKAVKILPEVNTRPYFPTITTPHMLEQKWTQLESALLKFKEANNKEVVW